MKNIITIDFDIIMKPSISLYNDLATDNWLDLLKMPEARLFRADNVIYRKVSNYVFKLINSLSDEQIIFIEDHSRVINYVNEDEKINLINIDHHHDTGYENNSFVSLDNINCGNWARWLLEQNNLNSYIWINNKNSEIDQEYVSKINNIIDINKINLDTLLKPDLLILCLSEPWVPPHHRPLYYIWQDYFEMTHGYKKDIVRGIYKFEI